MAKSATSVQSMWMPARRLPKTSQMSTTKFWLPGFLTPSSRTTRFSFNCQHGPGNETELVDALLEIASTEDGLTLLKNGGYSIGGLKAVDDSFYDEYRVYLEASGIDPTTLFK